MSIDPWIALLVVALTATMDALHVIYTKSVADNQAARAASFGSIMYLISGFAVIQYTENHIYLIFMAIGSWLGVYFTVRFHRKADVAKLAEANKVLSQ